jgi:hypothetical protein
MATDGYFRDKYADDSGGNRIRARCKQCDGAVSIIPGALPDEPCGDCGAVGIWREETDDEYAEFILGATDNPEPLSSRIAAEMKEPLGNEWTDVHEELIGCLEAFGDGRLSRWLRDKLSDPLNRPWISRVLDAYYTRDFLRRVRMLVDRTMRVTAMEPGAKPECGVNLYLREATRCYIFGFWFSSVALSRAAVEEALKDRLRKESCRVGKDMPNDNNLRQLSLDAKEMGLIDAAHLDLVDKVRLNGNRVLHGAPAQENDAGDCLAAARGVLNQLYPRT